MTVEGGHVYVQRDVVICSCPIDGSVSAREAKALVNCGRILIGKIMKHIGFGDEVLGFNLRLVANILPPVHEYVILRLVLKVGIVYLLFIFSKRFRMEVFTSNSADIVVAMVAID